MRVSRSGTAVKVDHALSLHGLAACHASGQLQPLLALMSGVVLHDGHHRVRRVELHQL